jgi:hypothetical protein
VTGAGLEQAFVALTRCRTEEADIPSETAFASTLGPDGS